MTTLPQPIRRPKLLARAAAAGARIYRRERDLSRLLPKMFNLAGPALEAALAAAEAGCESERRACAATYSVSRHVGLLAALLAERGPRAA